jgi:putative FmdB family regulatory protein
MPVYVYRCDYCGEVSEIFQHFTDDSLQVCPKCKESELQKVWLPVGVHFKGQGWYQTDKHKAAS